MASTDASCVQASLGATLKVLEKLLAQLDPEQAGVQSCENSAAVRCKGLRLLQARARRLSGRPER